MPNSIINKSGICSIVLAKITQKLTTLINIFSICDVLTKIYEHFLAIINIDIPIIINIDIDVINNPMWIIGYCFINGSKVV